MDDLRTKTEVIVIIILFISNDINSNYVNNIVSIGNNNKDYFVRYLNRQLWPKTLISQYQRYTLTYRLIK